MTHAPLCVSLTADGVLTIMPWREVTKDEAFKIIEAVSDAVGPILMAADNDPQMAAPV